MLIFDTFGLRAHAHAEHNASSKKSMFSREARRRNKERLLQATGIHKETKDDEAFVAKLEASKNLEKRLDDARRCV